MILDISQLYNNSNDNAELLLQDISNLYNNSNNHDVKIIVGNNNNVETFKAHSIILRIRSNYFNGVLSNKWRYKKDKNFTIIEQQNIKPQAFKIILEYFYTGSYSLDESNQEYIIELLFACDELELAELVTHIQENIIYNHTSWIQQNFVKFYKLPFKCKLMQGGYKFFEDKKFQIIREYCEELFYIRHELLFESKDFVTISKPLLITIIKKDDLELEEIDIWNYVIKWGMKQTPEIKSEISELTQQDLEVLKNRLRNVLQHVRFFTMSYDEFWDDIWPLKGIFSDHLLDKLVDYNLNSIVKISPPTNSLTKRIPKKFDDSNIISYGQANTLLNWIFNEDVKIECKLHVSYDLKLVHCGSRDGMDLETFYELCGSEYAQREFGAEIQKLIEFYNQTITIATSTDTLRITDEHVKTMSKRKPDSNF
ncbi:9128_t:CDS:2, partial [Funneliformis geosporum]